MADELDTKKNRLNRTRPMRLSRLRIKISGAEAHWDGGEPWLFFQTNDLLLYHRREWNHLDCSYCLTNHFLHYLPFRYANQIRITWLVTLLQFAFWFQTKYQSSTNKYITRNSTDKFYTKLLKMTTEPLLPMPMIGTTESSRSSSFWSSLKSIHGKWVSRLSEYKIPMI